MSFSLENLSGKGFDSAQPDRQLECHTESAAADSKCFLSLTKGH